MLLAAETLVVVTSGFLTGELLAPEGQAALSFLETRLAFLVGLPVVFVALAFGARLYDIGLLTRFPAARGAALGVLAVAFAVVAAAGLLAGGVDGIAPGWLLTWFVVALALLWLVRVLSVGLLARHEARAARLPRAAVYGSGAPLRAFMTHLDGVAQAPFRLAGVYGPAGDGETPGGELYDGDLEALLSAGRAGRIEAVVLAVPLGPEGSLADVVRRLALLDVAVHLFPDKLLDSVPHGFDRGELRLILLQPRAIGPWGAAFKATFDYVTAAISVVLLAPVLLAIAAAIRLEGGGPVLFRQARHGRNGRIFTCLKFRTMTAAASQAAFSQAVANDPRVTRLGRFLRRTSLDELPQLFNVLTGDMSMVGPRPHPLALDHQFSAELPDFLSRQRVKPGITGWAQVNDHRGPTGTTEDMLKRLECDLYYIANWSPWLDISIIAATPLVALSHNNAV